MCYVVAAPILEDGEAVSKPDPTDHGSQRGNERSLALGEKSPKGIHLVTNCIF